MKGVALVLGVVSVLLAGCASEGRFEHGDATAVGLSANNYRVIQPGAKGGSSGFSLLGIIPITSPSFAVAKERLYKSVGQEVKGRSIALANQTQDKSGLYLILFSIPTVTITADVIEFTGGPSTK
ncbi:MAG: DUF6567 family protein [Verrucomicrobiia bacterium]|jgi:hypothetical protein